MKKTSPEIYEERDERPLVSVIVPVYNAEKYLARCLDSLVGQSLREIEVLCVNDGSTDRSPEILNEYSGKDSRIRMFNQANRGPGAARNIALENARGKYIMFCDADDTMESDTCAECSAIMENNPVDMVVFNARVIEVDKRPLGFNTSTNGDDILIHKSCHYGGIINQIKLINISASGNTIWACCFRLDLINQYSLRFPHYRGEDIIFLQSYLMIIRRGGYVLDKIFYNYHIYAGSFVDGNFEEGNWVKRNFLFLSRSLGNAFAVAVKNKIFFRMIYVFYWLFMYGKEKMSFEYFSKHFNPPVSKRESPDRLTQ